MVTRRSLLAAAAALPFAGCTRQPELRIGYQTNGLLLAAKGRGSVEAALVGRATVTWRDFPSGPPLLEAMSLGDIDLGGAGRTLHDPLSANVPYEPPSDPFAWPQGSTRGDDLADRARPPGSQLAPTNGGTAAPGDKGSSTRQGDAGADGNGSGNGNGDANGNGNGNGNGGPTTSRLPDARPGATMTMALGGSEARRGAPMPVRGDVIADGEPCGHVTVEIVLASKNAADLPIGALATDEHGHYEGALVLPSTVPLGDYDVHARTMGDSRCGRGQTK